MRKPQEKRVLSRTRSVAGKISVRASREATQDRTRSRARGSAAKPSAGGSKFKVAARLQRAVASELSEHMRLCRKRRHAPKVPVYEYASKERGTRVATEGVATCKSRLCMFCRVKWQRVRAKEIKLAIDYWNRGKRSRVFFVTVTMRHNKSLSLGLMRRLLTAAWGSLWSGREGQALAKKLGGKPEMIRADDDTYSFEAYWHPHGHGLFFMQLDGHLSEELEEMLAERWRLALIKALKTFNDNVSRILEGDTCRMWNVHRGAIRRYEKGHTEPCSAIDDPGSREVLPGWVRVKPAPRTPTVEVIADDNAGRATARGELIELMRARGTGTGAVGVTGRGWRAWQAIEWRANYDASGKPRDAEGKPRKVPLAFCCGDDGRGQEPIAPSVYVKRFRRVCDPEDFNTCRPEHRRPTETTDQIADRIEEGTRDPWAYIAECPQCWACEQGRECPNLRRRMEKVFGRRMVRPHRSLVDSARDIEKKLRRFTKKAIEPNRRYGVKVEDVRTGSGLDNYLTKLGAMDNIHMELANGSSKVGHLGEDGLMHYAPPELAVIAATHGHPDRVQARRAYGELVRATFGLQPITFSNRTALGLGVDPYGDNADPEEPDERELMLDAARVLRIAAGREEGAERQAIIEEAEKIEIAAEDAGETKRFLGNIDGPKFDQLIKEGEERAEAGEGDCFLSELVQLHADWRLESADFLEPPDEEAGKPVRLKAATGPPALAGPSYGWARHVVEMEIRSRVDERLMKRAEDRAVARANGEQTGGAPSEESDIRAMQRLRSWFEEMRRDAADAE